MYFYVDESGHTGLNLFDPAQPSFYYGVLSSEVDLNLTIKDRVQVLRKRLGVKRLHANEMTNEQREVVMELMKEIHNEISLGFHLVLINKYDHSVFAFFDQIFDSGVNDCVSWEDYWTPKRYFLLYALYQLFDTEMAMQAWASRVSKPRARSNEIIMNICRQLAHKANEKGDGFSTHLIRPLLWAANNIDTLRYRASDKHSSLQMSPNAIGFQSVLRRVSSINEKNGADIYKSQIIVDQQSEFNGHQEWLFKYYDFVRETPLPLGDLGVNLGPFNSMPIAKPIFKAGAEDVGLELVDFVLWIARRFHERKDLPKSLEFYYRNYYAEQVEGISIELLFAQHLEPWIS